MKQPNNRNKTPIGLPGGTIFQEVIYAAFLILNGAFLGAILCMAYSQERSEMTNREIRESLAEFAREIAKLKKQKREMSK